MGHRGGLRQTPKIRPGGEDAPAHIRTEASEMQVAGLGHAAAAEMGVQAADLERGDGAGDGRAGQVIGAT